MGANSRSAGSSGQRAPAGCGPARRSGAGARAATGARAASGVGIAAGAATSASLSAGSPAHDCAAKVLEVVPSVMDSVRGAMRMHVGEQLSIPQFRCLNFIARTPGCSIGSAAAFLGVTMPTASAMVDRLVRAGAVATCADTLDRRRARLTLTDAGRTQLRAVRRGAKVEVARALSACSSDELRVLHEALAVLSRIFQSESNRA